MGTTLLRTQWKLSSWLFLHLLPNCKGEGAQHQFAMLISLLYLWAWSLLRGGWGRLGDKVQLRSLTSRVHEHTTGRNKLLLLRPTRWAELSAFKHRGGYNTLLAHGPLLEVLIMKVLWHGTSLRVPTSLLVYLCPGVALGIPQVAR